MVWHMAGVLPALIIIGAQKAGTTSLFNYLSQHPLFSPSRRKEVHYFDNRFGRSRRWYRSQFSKGGIAFEASPYYLFHPAVPCRVKKTVPNARFVVLLRDPVSRTISHYNHVVSLGLEDLPLSDALEAECHRLQGAHQRLIASASSVVPAHRLHSYVGRSRYAHQIERWLTHFPRSQFLFLVAEHMYRNPQLAVDSVCSFMNVPSHSVADTGAANQRSYVPAPAALQDAIRERVADDISRLPEMTGIRAKWMR